MEKGEAAIVGGQILALAVLVLLLGNFAGIGINGLSIPQISSVYWGPPSTGMVLEKGLVTVEKANSSTISVYYSLASATTISSVSASRLCLNPHANNTGEERTYTSIPISYDPVKHQNYVSFGSTDQPNNIGCYYTITITDSLQQVSTWTGTVKVVP